jgi:chemotaxis protein methyltransferase CheR
MVRNAVEAIKVASSQELTNDDFQKLSQFIYRKWGINLPSHKKVLLSGRLKKRIHTLGMNSFREYCTYLFSPEGLEQEPMNMVDLITTNKTDFFREADHFSYLAQTALPDLRKSFPAMSSPAVKIWSAGCSSGEEPHTLAMVLSEFAKTHQPFRFSIWATDISSRVLAHARMGIYELERIEAIPLELRKNYLLRSRDKENPVVRFSPEIRGKIQFERLNLMEMASQVRDQFHVIFCRNVLIYFDRPTQEKMIRDFYHFLEPGGYLFLGHSETMTGFSIPLLPMAPTVYQKSGEVKKTGGRAK